MTSGSRLAQEGHIALGLVDPGRVTAVIDSSTTRLELLRLLSLIHINGRLSRRHDSAVLGRVMESP